MIYNEKKVSRSWFFLAVESAPVDGVGLVSCDVSLAGGACARVLVDAAGSCLSEGQRSVQ